ncbi:hypothetical protein SLEP1_g58120 [Rubroshorea leprosula]|uniref:Uncharacterized protein n=1 Tax=Rubroshorea leprosula TaxID=152421 RepID=A0AAV5MPI5_9ROSI|nr:hypothetical protein SLEP1_g58120 [Rubroshorea leprosula]
MVLPILEVGVTVHIVVTVHGTMSGNVEIDRNSIVIRD